MEPNIDSIVIYLVGISTSFIALGALVWTVAIRKGHEREKEKNDEAQGLVRDEERKEILNLSKKNERIHDDPDKYGIGIGPAILELKKIGKSIEGALNRNSTELKVTNDNMKAALENNTQLLNHIVNGSK